MIKEIMDYYKSLSANGRRRLLMHMGVSLPTLYRRTADTLTAYEIRALIKSGMDRQVLYRALGI